MIPRRGQRRVEAVYRPTQQSLTKNGVWHPLEIDLTKLHDLFRENVLNALLRKELITEEVADNMLSWEHSGFNVWSGEPFTEPDLWLFLARYLKKSPVSLDRMSVTESGLVSIIKKSDNETRVFTPLEFLAELSSITSTPSPAPSAKVQMKIVAFIHDANEITALARNRGIQPYRAPPPLVATTKQALQQIIPFYE